MEGYERAFKSTGDRNIFQELTETNSAKMVTYSHDFRFIGGVNSQASYLQGASLMFLFCVTAATMIILNQLKFTNNFL